MKKKIKHSRQGSNGIVHGSYFGEVNNNNIPHGKGKCTFEDGFVYEGYWKNGKRGGTACPFQKLRGYGPSTGVALFKIAGNAGRGTAIS